MSLKDYQELVVWQKSMDLVEKVYRATARFPKEEIYGLTSRIRRAAVSVPSNIAEGQGRSTTAAFLNFLSVARGSLKEPETQILIAQRLEYVDVAIANELTDLIAQISRLLSGLTKSLRRKLE